VDEIKQEVDAMMESVGQHVHAISLEELQEGAIHCLWLHIINNKIGEPVRVPIMIARGREDGPVLGLTAALHGNELNGIRVIQRLFDDLNPEELRGTVIGVLIANVSGVLREQRSFIDGVDLNHIFPGRSDGNVSQLFVHRFLERIIRHFDFLIDLHTASFGRVNSYYIRADMSDPEAGRMARLQRPQIILDHVPSGSTLRGAAADRGISGVTLELQDPHLFQKDVVTSAILGVRNVLIDFGMIPGEISVPDEEPILCDRSYWLYTDEGGFLSVLPEVTRRIRKGDTIARVRTVFGEVTREFFAPEDGIVIGKSVNPLNQSGSRILHLGINPRQVSLPTGETMVRSAAPDQTEQV
jgi:predicted deacylase